jgi:DNA-binding XRE family transcriptional regulator
MGVCHNAVLDWENGKQPTDRQYPTIILFLGFEPWPAPITLPEKLIAARRRRGLSAKRAACALTVDESTYAGWEAGRHVPSKQYGQSLQTFVS